MERRDSRGEGRACLRTDTAPSRPRNPREKCTIRIAYNISVRRKAPARPARRHGATEARLGTGRLCDREYREPFLISMRTHTPAVRRAAAAAARTPRAAQPSAGDTEGRHPYRGGPGRRTRACGARMETVPSRCPPSPSMEDGRQPSPEWVCFPTIR